MNRNWFEFNSFAQRKNRYYALSLKNLYRSS